MSLHRPGLSLYRYCRSPIGAVSRHIAAVGRAVAPVGLHIAVVGLPIAGVGFAVEPLAIAFYRTGSHPRE